MSEDSRPLSSLPIPPSTLSTLTRAGYETVNDIHSHSTAGELTDALKIPLAASQALLSSQPARKVPKDTSLPLTQSAASLARSRKQKIKLFSTRCPPIDQLLEGGLSRGHVLEVPGPPGSAKETILLNVVRSFAEVGEAILFVDCQNMCNPSSIEKRLEGISNAKQLVSYIKIHTLLEFMIFMHNLSSYIESNPQISCLALSSMSFPFQHTSGLPTTAKAFQLEQVKQILSKNCASRNLTVAITTHLSTKMINADGTTGSFDSAGAKSVMVPQLGTGYLPPGRSHRILFSLDSRAQGRARLLPLDNRPAGKIGESEPFSLAECVGT